MNVHLQKRRPGGTSHSTTAGPRGADPPELSAPSVGAAPAVWSQRPPLQRARTQGSRSGPSGPPWARRVAGQRRVPREERIPGRRDLGATETWEERPPRGGETTRPPPGEERPKAGEEKEPRRPGGRDLRGGETKGEGRPGGRDPLGGEVREETLPPQGLKLETARAPSSQPGPCPHPPPSPPGLGKGSPVAVTRVREKLEEARKPGADSALPAAPAPARALCRACPVQEPKTAAVPVPAVVGGAWGRERGGSGWGGAERVPANQRDVAKPVAEGSWEGNG